MTEKGAVMADAHRHNALCTHDYCVHDPSVYERREPGTAIATVVLEGSDPIGGDVE